MLMVYVETLLKSKIEKSCFSHASIKFDKWNCFHFMELELKLIKYCKCVAGQFVP